MWRMLFLFCWLIPAGAALADGCYIPERAVKKVPEIPAQRAILSWRDGTETLVISSALNSESQKLGWIIPLPAVPSRIGKESPGALKTLDFCLQPEITHDLARELGSVLLVVFLANIVLGTLVFKPERLRDLLLLILLCALLAGMLLPALGTAASRASRSNLAQVEKTARVGSYEVTVLRARKAGELGAWLEGNGFAPLPERAAGIVEGYIAENWVFAAIKLAREETGVNAPHPVRMVFPAAAPVYPLKLTALAGGETRFELFVLSADGVACGELKKEFSDRFSKWVEEDATREKAAKVLTFRGTASKARIGHPVLCDMMWHGCVVTKFSGAIKAERMTADIRFSDVPFKAYRQHFYTRHGAVSFSLILFLWAGGAWLFAAMLAFFFTGKNRSDPAAVRAYFLRAVLPPALGMAAVIATIGFFLPRLDNSEVTFSRGLAHRYDASRLEWMFAGKIEGNKAILLKPEGEIAAFLAAQVGGAGIRVEDSPGNFTVEKDAKNVVIRIYDNDGSPRTLTYPLL